MKPKTLLVWAGVALALIWAYNSCDKPKRTTDPGFPGSVCCDRVTGVKDGNTLLTSCNREVKLLGVRQSQAVGDAFLSQYIGHNVHVIEDRFNRQDPKKRMLQGYAVLDDHRCLNHMLLQHDPSLFDNTTVRDSLAPFTPHDDPVDVADLPMYIKQRTMLVEVPDQGRTSYGTAFFINNDGYAITNNHVYDGRGKAYVYLYDPADNGKHDELRRAVPGVVYTDPDRDITIMQVALRPGDHRSYLRLARGHVPVGTDVATVGNPVGSDGLHMGYFSKGSVSQYGTAGSDGMPLVYYTLESDCGNSGGAVCDKTGTVVAIHQGGDRSRQNANYGIDILALREVLDSIELPYGGK